MGQLVSGPVENSATTIRLMLIFTGDVFLCKDDT
uniref:Uncharacterized protein n=1 Tax=Arundo donax TaxID=35708 RepID=A0A0A9HEM0_ARUDO